MVRIEVRISRGEGTEAVVDIEAVALGQDRKCSPSEVSSVVLFMVVVVCEVVMYPLFGALCSARFCSLTRASGLGSWSEPLIACKLFPLLDIRNLNLVL